MSTSASAALPTIVGVGLSATGIAHFLVPNVFRSITAPAFPNDTDAAIQRNGAIETVVGAAIAIPKTRKIGLVAAAGYIGYLGHNAVRNR